MKLASEMRQTLTEQKGSDGATKSSGLQVGLRVCLRAGLSSAPQTSRKEIDVSCHCINWLSERLCEEKLQSLGSERRSDNDGEMKERERWGKDQEERRSEVKIWERPRPVNVSLRPAD